MPSYNQARYIERSILSVLNQDYENLELIIVDGGSQDGTAEIVSRFEKYLAHWESVPDRGQSHALNKGFARATGEIFGWLNSDDLYLPGALRYAVDTFIAAPGASVVFGDWWQIDVDDNVTESHYAFDFSLGHLAYEGFHLNAQAMFWRRGAHERLGAFDEKLHRTMDYDLILRLGISEGQTAFKRIPAPLACFRRHPEQKTREIDVVVLEEHRRIACTNGFENKYGRLGRLLRWGYRVRRAYWYWRRGGFGYFFEQFADWGIGGVRGRRRRT